MLPVKSIGSSNSCLEAWFQLKQIVITKRLFATLIVIITLRGHGPDKYTILKRGRGPDKMCRRAGFGPLAARCRPLI